MTDEQFRYLVKIVRQRIAEETHKLNHSTMSGNHGSLSYLYGKTDALREVLFWLHGMASDTTEDAFK